MKHIDMTGVASKIYAKPVNNNDVTIRIEGSLGMDRTTVEATISVDAIPSLIAALGSAAIVAARNNTSQPSKAAVEGDEIAAEIEGDSYRVDYPPHSCTPGTDIRRIAPELMSYIAQGVEIDWDALVAEDMPADTPSESANW